jgi:HD-GYP domain-containing protein (c-di-GMP phosphodiesterase class II)
MNNLELLATLHDIGKIGISDQILNKPDKLSPEEWVEMKKHPEIGYRIAMSSPELVPIAEYILTHHERWDGEGYPQKLAGERIPLLSRILAVVDAYDAMTEDRPYRKAMSKEEAVMEIRENLGKQFDPLMAKIFLGRVLEVE